MVQRGCSLRLALEARQSLRVAGYCLRQKLQRNEAMQPGVLCFVDHTHAATAELFDDPVMRNDLPEQGRNVDHWLRILVFALHQVNEAQNNCSCKVRMSGLSKIEMSAFMGRGAHGNGAYRLEPARTRATESAARGK